MKNAKRVNFLNPLTGKRMIGSLIELPNGKKEITWIGGKIDASEVWYEIV